MATRKVEAAGRIERAIELGARYLVDHQAEDGSFDLGFDGGALPDAHFVFIHSTLELGQQETCRRLARRLLDRQLPEGSWALAPGLGGHLGTTVEAYVALRAVGLGAEELPLQRARRYIHHAGGLDSVRGPTRVTLALLGLASWADLAIPAPEVALLPSKAPVSLFKVGALLRLHVLPLLVLRAQEVVLAPRLGRAVGAELAATQIPAVRPRPGPRHQEALEACVRLMTERLDEDGSLGGLLMATGWAAAAARALRLPQDHPLTAVTPGGLRALVHDVSGRDVHVQVCRPVVRSTVEALAALRAAGVDGRAVDRARDSLLTSRAGPHGDYEILGPQGPAVAWSIKPGSGRFPSLLDTARAVRALDGLEGCSDLLDDAQRWVSSMQRRDGGFALFDRDAATAPWLRRLPFGLLVHTLNDVSSPEVTGRILELASRRGGLHLRDVERACGFLARAQQSDGAFRGPFSAGLLAGSSAAISGLSACGRGTSRVSARAVGFLLEHQRPEGGWGESPLTASGDAYVDLGRSVPSHTATALSGLLAAGTPAAMQGAHRAAEFLLWTQEPDGSWAEDDPSSAGLADVVYLRNPVDRVAKPLAALAAYAPFV